MAYKGLDQTSREQHSFVARNSRKTDVDLPEEPEALGYDRNDTGVLWDLSTADDPINPDMAEEEMKRSMGFAHIGRFTQYERRMRKRLVDSIFIKDPGDVKPGTYHPKKTCWEKHPGLCITRDKAFLQDALMSAHRLHQFTKMQCHCFIVVRSISKSESDEEEEIETYHYVGCMRKQDPVIALTAACVMMPMEKKKHMTVSIVRNDDAQFVLQTSFHICQLHYGWHSPKLPNIMTIERLRHKNIPNTVSIVEIVEDAIEEASLLKTEKTKQTKNRDERDDDPFKDVFFNLVKEEEADKEDTRKDKKKHKKKDELESESEDPPRWENSEIDTGSSEDSDFDFIFPEPEPPPAPVPATPPASPTPATPRVPTTPPVPTTPTPDSPVPAPVVPPTPTPPRTPATPVPLTPTSPAPPSPPAPVPAPVPPPPPRPLDLPDPDSITPGHVRVWLTRTAREAKCSSCDEAIKRHSFRMCFHPDPKTNPDRRIWRKCWWTYHHITEECVLRTPVQEYDIAPMFVDCAKLPKMFHESDEACMVGTPFTIELSPA